MTKQELSKKVAAQLGCVSTIEAQAVIEVAMDVIKSSIAKGESVYLRGFGTFATKHRAEKIGRNISRNTPVVIPAHNIPYFKPSKAFIVK